MSRKNWRELSPTKIYIQKRQFKHNCKAAHYAQNIDPKKLKNKARLILTFMRNVGLTFETVFFIQIMAYFQSKLYVTAMC